MSNTLTVTQELLYLLWVIDVISDELMDDVYYSLHHPQLKGDDK